MKYIILILLLLAACNNTQAQDSKEFRIDVLYEHTKQMQYFVNEEELQQLGIDMKPFEKDNSLISYEEKLEILAESYGTTNTDIDYLEKRMEQMMDDWVELESKKLE